jgi:hypothetical protein
MMNVPPPRERERKGKKKNLANNGGYKEKY